MGTVVKLLSAACKLSGTSCNDLRFPHHPLVVQKTKTLRVDLSMCLRSVHSFKPIPFRELPSFLTPNPCISFRFHFLHSPKYPTASVVSFLSIPQAPLIQSVTTQALFQSFPPSPQGEGRGEVYVFIFCGGLAPTERILLVLIRNGFFLKKDSKTNLKKTNTTRTF